jgi:leader peptidase (prepilin peptidase) / N-methyltransferase
MTAAPLALAIAALAACLAGFVTRRELGGDARATLLAQFVVVAASTLCARLFGPDLTASLYLGALVVLCLAVVRIDAKLLIIPDTLVIGLCAIALLAPFRPPLLEQAIGAVAMGLLFTGVRQAYFALRGIEGLGLGDVKLAIAIGAVLGAETAFIATGLAAACTAAWLALHARASATTPQCVLTTKAPFGVGLASALAVVAIAIVVPAWAI